MPEDEISIAIA